MLLVTLNEIKAQEKKIDLKLNGRDAADPTLEDELKNDIKWYFGLCVQYNSYALTTKDIKPYKDKYYKDNLSEEEFLSNFEKERKDTIQFIEWSNNPFERMNTIRIQQHISIPSSSVSAAQKIGFLGNPPVSKESTANNKLLEGQFGEKEKSSFNNTM